MPSLVPDNDSPYSSRDSYRRFLPPEQKTHSILDMLHTNDYLTQTTLSQGEVLTITPLHKLFRQILIRGILICLLCNALLSLFLLLIANSQHLYFHSKLYLVTNSIISTFYISFTYIFLTLTFNWTLFSRRKDLQNRKGAPPPFFIPFPQNPPKKTTLKLKAPLLPYPLQRKKEKNLAKIAIFFS